MKIAIAQLNPTIGDIEGNAQQIIDASEQAAEKGAHLLLTPELSLCGYPPRDLLLYPRFIESLQKKLEVIAKAIPAQLSVLVGTVVDNPQSNSQGQKPLYNAIALLQASKISQIFHKRLLPTYDVFDEDRYFQPGEQTNSFTFRHSSQTLTLGVTICEDLWNDETFWGKRTYKVNPLAELAALHVDLMVNLSASPYSVGKPDLREKMLTHAVKQYQIPLIYSNQVGANDDLIFDGNSLAVNQQGKVIERAKSFENDLIICELEQLQSGQAINKKIFTQQTDENQAIFSALVLGVKDYARKCGFTQVLLGLSGGIDSALVAAIAAEALGQDNVLGVLMPSPYSSQSSITDALALAANLGIKTQTIPIQTGMSAYDQMLEPLFAGTEFGITEENIQSRLRGGLLMAIANKFNYLLLSTGNKSEIAVGYCTLYGDMNGGLAVIADVPKTRVFELCRWLNHKREIIPTNIITKPPSAELKPDQKDTDSLPSYDILDDILDQIICQHRSEQEVIDTGHDQAIVTQVFRLLARAEFKRRQAAPGLKITDRAFGTGWRMPIASRWLIDND